ncbi:hypothetical protein [Sphingobium sp. B12D2B]|uniref:hypothetical protein n=1 Tax=Sphingobium sp. B12D2B TaxID=2940577 RepID=UPI0022256E85|nr:hypothetical protein [Sphingobium sp. B12D2B]MCW2351798.1 hypothetical protein [Sphingobium sp. B12D2B]
MAQGGVLDIDVAGKTSPTGGVLAAVDGSGANSGKLSLQTGTLAVADIADHADSRSISIGLSGAVNDPLKASGGKLGAPTIDGAFANSTVRQETRGTIGQGTVSVASLEGGTALADVNRDLTATQVVTKDSQSGATLYTSATSIREGIGLATGDRSQSAILATGDKLAADPLAAIKAVVGEVQSFSDHLAESGATERLLGGIDRLLRGNDAVNLGQVIAQSTDPRFAGKGADEIAAIQIEDRAAYIERTLGKDAADQFRSEAVNNPVVRGWFSTNANALVSLGGAGNITDLAQLIGLGIGTSGAASSAPVGTADDLVVNGQRKLGDAVAHNLVVAQDYLTDLATSHPALFATMQIGLSLGKGPIGALGSYALDQAVQKVMAETGLDRKAAELDVLPKVPPLISRVRGCHGAHLGKVAQAAWQHHFPRVSKGRTACSH